MLLRPQLPETPTPTLPATTQHTHAPACTCQHSHTPTAPAHRSLPSVSTGAVAVVLVGGVVLTALLTAVAVSAISVAVAAVVVRSLLGAQHRRR
ncbi:hypothetical protein OIE63_23145 [Streptomyces sp. NBC_01795]|uniref:hypothetical protein n=1 Tax=Streptomyces sp. NBC_01795 TaxID=2975943 RepID=UPI002DD7A687|nr:hypothetical protein [Streptomyces sp. NBC_01795]WSA94152.1 hypothetical protein OIE63_23145 [Streptomyces sp. NBC_01795]